MLYLKLFIHYHRYQRGSRSLTHNLANPFTKEQVLWTYDFFQLIYQTTQLSSVTYYTNSIVTKKCMFSFNSISLMKIVGFSPLQKSYFGPCSNLNNDIENYNYFDVWFVRMRGF